MDAIGFILFIVVLLMGSSAIALKAWFNNKQYEAEQAQAKAASEASGK